jgi:hypothetical protein
MNCRGARICIPGGLYMTMPEGFAANSANTAPWPRASAATWHPAQAPCRGKVNARAVAERRSHRADHRRLIGNLFDPRFAQRQNHMGDWLPPSSHARKTRLVMSASFDPAIIGL